MGIKAHFLSLQCFNNLTKTFQVLITYKCTITVSKHFGSLLGVGTMYSFDLKIHDSYKTIT